MLSLRCFALSLTLLPLLFENFSTAAEPSRITARAILADERQACPGSTALTVDGFFGAAKARLADQEQDSLAYPVNPSQRILVAFFDEHNVAIPVGDAKFTDASLFVAGQTAALYEVTLAANSSLADAYCVAIPGTGGGMELLRNGVTPGGRLRLEVKREGGTRIFWMHRAKIQFHTVAKLVGLGEQCPGEGVDEARFLAGVGEDAIIRKTEDATPIYHRRRILIAFFGNDSKPLTVEAVDFRSAELAIVTNKLPPDAPLKSLYKTLRSGVSLAAACVALPGGSDALWNIAHEPDAAPAKILVEFGHAEQFIGGASVVNKWRSDDGLWSGNYLSLSVRYGLFGFHPRKTETGVRVAPTPAVVTVGSRRTVFGADTGFFFAGTVAYERTSTMDPGTKNVFDLTTLGVGGLLDIERVLYLGGAWSFSLRSGNPDPGFSVLIGLGTKVIAALAGPKKPESK